MEVIKEMIPFVYKGGILMVPLLLCSVIALAIIIERAISLHRLNIDFSDYLVKIRKLLEMDKAIEAIALCESMPEPFSHIFKEGVLSRGRTKAEISEALGEVGLLEIPKLEKYIPVLGTIASISPLLGLLGTVTGMIRAFNVMALEGAGKPMALAGGISEALITTATGLSIAIPTLVFYNIFTNHIDHLVRESEKGASLLSEIVASPQE